ncbi:tRNA (guanine(10)-N2)-methyltransferase homolog [Physella acuta]|uniref:tRNA (guanine(10)-N2)-methyltransferase homolog n=1 Tax=Physella acuta TaxID=109671 RepID=UPI0027DBA101|nr:tRNA (guanine(10)-N2)-methyltransferase homolog [Physella acuta]
MATRLACAVGLSREPLKRYLIQFAHDHLDFRLQEVKSIISLLGCKALLKDDDLGKGNPFMELELSSETDAKAIMHRSVLSKRIYELWADGECLSEVCEKINLLPEEITAPYTQESSSFRIMVEAFNKKISTSEKIKRIEQLTTVNSTFRGKIDLSCPDHSFHLLEFYKFDSVVAATKPEKVYFGRWVTDGQRNKIQEYHLQKRHFIANTSMDACLSLVMANLAQVKQDDLVIDPFVGSGSLLVSSAHYGAFVLGTDIDYLLLHARARPSRAKQTKRSIDESVWSNLKQYGLESRYLDVLVADASQLTMWRDNIRFDAIITDPPYGIREAAAKISTKENSDKKITDPEAPRYPQKSQYQLGDIFCDLLNFAAKYLTIGGRLVYWLPIYKPDYSESNIPQHPCLRLESNCEQPLNTSISRRLITMQKIAEVQNVVTKREATIMLDNFQSFRKNYFKPLDSSKGKSQGHNSCSDTES